MYEADSKLLRDALESGLVFIAREIDMTFVRSVAAAAVVFCLAGCADRPAVTASTPTVAEDGTVSDGGASPAQMAVLAAGTALPAGYKVDTGRTMIFGTDERWTGRLSYTTNTAADEVFDFLHREMPNFGWAEISAMRSDNSILNFTSAGTGRLATVTIRRAGLGLTQVDMVVSPQAVAN